MSLPTLLWWALWEALAYGFPALICLAIKKKTLGSVIVSWTISWLFLFLGFLWMFSHDGWEIVLGELLSFIVSATIVVVLCILVTVKYRKQKLMKKDS